MNLPIRATSVLLLTLLAGAFFLPANLPGSSHLPAVFTRPITLGLDLQGGTALTYEVDFGKTRPEDAERVYDGVRTVLEKRVNQLGVTEASVTPASAGDARLLIVELPGVKDIAEARAKVGKVVVLEFFEQAPGGGWTTQPALSGEHFDFADVAFDQFGRPEVSVTFTDEGARLFGDLTTKNIGKPVGIFLDGQLLTAPTVQAAITGGQATITGNYTMQEATDLAKNLNTGAIPAPVKLIGESTVGPTLGLAQLEMSVKAGLIGVAILALGMVAIYRLAGLLSVVALGVYTLVLGALFKFFGIALTLAGVAGFIMSLGMAIDANVLIFERMKEEFARGAGKVGFMEIMQHSFARAWEAIRDSNYSTLITCAVLFYFGSGLVRGFSLTLALGILVSMITAIFVTRVFIELAARVPALCREGVMVSAKK